jgi:hypothetical protein
MPFLMKICVHISGGLGNNYTKANLSPADSGAGLSFAINYKHMFSKEVYSIFFNEIIDDILRISIDMDDILIDTSTLDSNI